MQLTFDLEVVVTILDSEQGTRMRSRHGFQEGQLLQRWVRVAVCFFFYKLNFVLNTVRVSHKQHLIPS